MNFNKYLHKIYEYIYLIVITDREHVHYVNKQGQLQSWQEEKTSDEANMYFADNTSLLTLTHHTANSS